MFEFIGLISFGNDPYYYEYNQDFNLQHVLVKNNNIIHVTFVPKVMSVVIMY